MNKSGNVKAQEKEMEKKESSLWVKVRGRIFTLKLVVASSYALKDHTSMLIQLSAHLLCSGLSWWHDLVNHFLAT